MATANIKCHSSIERVYSPQAFAEDSAHNLEVTAEIRQGVLILSAPNASGDFVLERSTRHVGEPESDTFLMPFRGATSADPEAVQPDPRAGYDAFVMEIISAAERFGFVPDESPGLNEPRLQGLRQ